jgi:hypothetical protein
LKKRTHAPLVKAILSSIAAAWQAKDLTAVVEVDSKETALTVNGN